jgi:hypothetical protein
MRALCCVLCLALTIIFIEVSQAGAGLCPCPTPATSVCAGKLDLRFSISKTGALGSLSMTRCPFPVCHTLPGGTITITDSSSPPQTLTLPVAGNPPPPTTKCTGVDKYGIATGGTLRYVFGAKATITAKHMAAPAIAALTAPVTVTVTDGSGYTATAQLMQCQTGKNGSIRCK